MSTLTDIVGSLRRDGYNISQIEGPALKRQLRDLIRAALLEDINTPRTS